METPTISEVETLTFDSLSIDTIVETPFTTSPTVSSGIAGECERAAARDSFGQSIDVENCCFAVSQLAEIRLP